MGDLKGLAVDFLGKDFLGIVLDVGSFTLVRVCSPQAYFASGFIYEKSDTLQGETVRLPNKANTVVR